MNNTIHPDFYGKILSYKQTAIENSLVKKTLCSLLIINTLFLSACANKLHTVSPEDVDLSGRWILNNTYSQEVILLSQKRQGPEGKKGQGRERGKKGAGRGNDHGSSPKYGKNEQENRPQKSPIMTAKEITITQNSDSMGIAYINQPYRDVDWGKTKMWDRTIKAGWNNKSQLVIETAKQKSNITETYQLNANGNILTLIIDVNGNEHGGEYRRVFEKKPL